MTNPNNAIGTNGAFSGRTSPNALNDITAGYTKGIVSGWACSPKSGMTIQIGGAANTRDVALAEDNAGNKLTINNRSAAPVEITLSGAPATNNRIDAIVAYIDNPSTGDGSTTDNPTTCGIIPVSGTVAANPVAPTDAQIRTAITNDGATGGSAYYIILATVLVGTGVTTIGAGVITQGQAATSTVTPTIPANAIETAQIKDAAVTDAKIDWTTLGAPSSGYLKLGTTKIQWGVNTVTMNGTSAGSFGSKTVTLPTSMTGTDYAVVVTPQDPGSTNALKITAQGKQTGQFTATAGTAATSGSATITFSWIAIGE